MMNKKSSNAQRRSRPANKCVTIDFHQCLTTDSGRVLIIIIKKIKIFFKFLLSSKDEPTYRSLQILVISIPVLIFSFIAAQSNAKFLKDQDLIKTYENDENPAEEADINVSNSQNEYTEPKQRKFSEKYHKAKRRQRKFKQKTVNLLKMHGNIAIRQNHGSLVLSVS